MTSLKISAILPFHNGEKYVFAALESINAQILRPCELIIIDDGSQESASEYLNSIKMEIPTRILKQKHSGQSAARNRAASIAVGDYIGFLDQDDIWYPHHLKKLSEPFEEDLYRIGWVYSNFDEIEANGQLVQINYLDKQMNCHPKYSILEIIKQDCFVLPSASLILKKAFLEVNGFDERLCGYEDDDLFRRFFSAGWRHYYISSSSCAWRVHTSSASYSTRMDISRKTYSRKLIEAYPNYPMLNRFWINEFIIPRFLRSQMNSFWFYSIKLKNFELAQNAKQQFYEYLKMLSKEHQGRWKLCYGLLMWPRLNDFIYHKILKFFPKSILKLIGKIFLKDR
jgi:glycosyltransferase involved in cell wall biosynthesis